MDEDNTLADSSDDTVITIDSTNGQAAAQAAFDFSDSIDSVTFSGNGDSMASGSYVLTMPSSPSWTTAGTTITTIANNGSGYYGNLTLTGSTYVQPNNSWVIGDQDDTKSKVYIVEPWQSKCPIQVEDGLWISLEKDLISTGELKEKIMNKLEETHPEIVIKMGINKDNMKLVKREVNLEIKSGSEDEK